MDTCIEVLPDSALKAVLSKTSMGDMADTYQCIVEWTNGKTTKAYLKRIQNSRKLTLVNEVTGFIIGKGCGLPVPQYAGLIKPSADAFPPNSDIADWSFVVSDVPGTAPASFYHMNLLNDCAALMNKIAGWNKISDTLAFDDWTANEDRHIGNILVAGKNNIYLIDHGNLPITLNWEAYQLNPHYQAKSILAENLWLSKCIPLPIKANVSSASKDHAVVFDDVKDELLHWWDILLGHDPDRRQALEHFIATRARLGVTRISQNYNMLAI